MDSSSFYSAVLMQWGAQSPALLVYFFGVVVALTYWQSRRMAAALTLCAMILLGMLTLGMPAIWLGLPLWQSEHGWTLKQAGFVSTAINLTSSVVHAVGVGLLLAAAFYRRSSPVASGMTNPPPPLPPL